MGDLIRTPFSEVIKAVEILDHFGVVPCDLEAFRKASSWSQKTVARVFRTDPSVWAALELEDAAARMGFTPGELRALAQKEDLLRQFHQVFLGQAEIKLADHVIDCNADPVLMNGWSVEKHEKTGSFKWDPKQVQFYLSKSQNKDSYIEGNKLRKELAGKPVLNASVLDYLLKNQQLIPEEWKEKTNGYTTCIFFLGTIYRDVLGDRCVRCLSWHDGAWRWNYRWLDNGWFDHDPAALRAS